MSYVLFFLTQCKCPVLVQFNPKSGPQMMNYKMSLVQGYYMQQIFL
jgi:hypothetical protein